jgi:hypothetical protein
VCNQLDGTFRWSEVQPVVFTAAPPVNPFVLAGDATSVDLDATKSPVVSQTSAVIEFNEARGVDFIGERNDGNTNARRVAKPSGGQSQALRDSTQRLDSFQRARSHRRTCGNRW